MKSYFNINASSEEQPSDDLWLIVQYGAGLMGYILFSPRNLTVLQSNLWYNDNDSRDSLEITEYIHQEIAARFQVSKTILINYHPAYFAVPDIIYRPEKLNDWMHLIKGEHPGEITLVKKSILPEVVHIQPISKTFHKLFTQKFQADAIYSFQEFGFEIDEYIADALHVTFFHQHIFVNLYKGGNLYLNQAYLFETPEDVLFQLLHIADQFSLEISSLIFIPEGFIDAASSLYKLLEQYFSKIQQPGQFTYKYPETSETLSPYILRYIDRIITCVS